MIYWFESHLRHNFLHLFCICVDLCRQRTYGSFPTKQVRLTVYTTYDFRIDFEGEKSVGIRRVILSVALTLRVRTGTTLLLMVHSNWNTQLWVVLHVQAPVGDIKGIHERLCHCSESLGQDANIGSRRLISISGLNKDLIPSYNYKIEPTNIKYFG